MESTAIPIAARFDEAVVDSIFATVNQSQFPGVAVGIAIEGRPMYRKGFGLANMELPTLLTPSMRMRIGSTTKHFASLAYLLLCEEGLAGVDDEIGSHVAGLHAVTRDVTMRQLMGHVSGIRDLLSVSLVTNGVSCPVSDREMLAYYRTIEDVDFEPGTRWSYNNGGYTLLTAAIESITGQTLDEVLRERIFEPVGLNDTLLRRWDDDLVPNSAALHYRQPDGRFCKMHIGKEMSGSGGMVSTMNDMLLWLRHMDAPVVGSAETWAMIRNPQRLKNGCSTGYGMGLIGECYRGIQVLHHSGGLIGGNSQMIKVPDAKLDITIAANRSDVSSVVLALQVIDACVDGLEAVPEPPAYEKQTGTFVSGTSDRVVTLSVKNDRHLMAIDGSQPVPVARDADGVLQLPAALAFLQQALSVGDHEIRLSDFGNWDTLTEIAEDSAARLGDHVGSYRSEALDATLIFVETDGDRRASIHGRHGRTEYSLEPITADIWRIENIDFAPLSMIITFDSDDRSLRLDSTRMRHVRFIKVD